MIEKDNIKPFLNKRVSIVKMSGFTLYGWIRKINDTSIVFESDNATSVMSIEGIDSIIETKNKRGEQMLEVEGGEENENNQS